MNILNKLKIGFYLLLVSLIFAIAAFVMNFATFNAFHYENDRYIIALMIIAFWCLLCIIVTSVINHKEGKIVDVLYLIAIFSITIALVKFLIPCLSPIGIYFTVHNMGDVEANAIGVPRSIVTIVLFVISIATLIASSFLPVRKENSHE